MSALLSPNPRLGIPVGPVWNCSFSELRGVRPGGTSLPRPALRAAGAAAHSVAFTYKPGFPLPGVHPRPCRGPHAPKQRGPECLVCYSSGGPGLSACSRALVLGLSAAPSRGFEPRELPAGLSLGGTPELSYLSAVPSSAQLPAPPSSTRLWPLPLKNALLFSGPSPPPFHSLHLIFEDSTPGSVPLWSYEGLGYRAVVFQLCFPVSKERDTFLPIKGRGWMCPLASSHTHPWLAGRLFLPIVVVVHKCVLRTRIEKSKCQNLGFTYLTKTNDRFQTRLFFEYLFPCS